MTFSDPTGCTVVVVGGEHINKFEDVMESVDKIGDEMSRLPEAVFVFLNDDKYPENIFSKDNRHVSSPTMVKRILPLLIEFLSFISLRPLFIQKKRLYMKV